MFEKIGRAAEQMASNVGVSRRGFLGLLGQGALVTAGTVGALLLLPSKAQADKPNCCNGGHRCRRGYSCFSGSCVCVFTGG
jgi:hypothetical protein